METKTEDYRNELFYQPKNGYDRIDTEERLVMEQYAEEYKKFLNEARTEREAVKLAVEMAEAQGFVPYERGMDMAPRRPTGAADSGGNAAVGGCAAHS